MHLFLLFLKLCNQIVNLGGNIVKGLFTIIKEEDGIWKTGILSHCIWSEIKRR